MSEENLSAIRQRAKKILDGAVPEGAEYHSKGQGAAEFTRYTNYTQQTLQSNWDSGGIMTACNGFTGWYSLQLGSKEQLNKFDVKKHLQALGRSEAWVASTKGRRPKYGDILLHATLHMDVAIGFDDAGHLRRVAAGQAGKKQGYDSLTRVTGTQPYDYTKLQGWVDIDVYFATATAGLEWLVGWWAVSDGNSYYYYFSPAGTVQYTKTPPAVKTAPVMSMLNQGKYTYTSPNLVVTWDPLDGGSTIETFYDARPQATTMKARSNRYAPLTATRLR
jgi:hypothetical protein